MTPGGPFCTESRREPEFGRHILAEGKISAAGAYESPSRAPFLAGGQVPTGAAEKNAPPARIRRRKAQLRRNPVGNPRSGAIFSPEAACWQESCTKLLLRRQLLAGGRVPAAIVRETRVPAPSLETRPRRSPHPNAVHTSATYTVFLAYSPRGTLAQDPKGNP